MVQPKDSEVSLTLIFKKTIILVLS